MHEGCQNPATGLMGRILSRRPAWGAVPECNTGNPATTGNGARTNASSRRARAVAGSEGERGIEVGEGLELQRGGPVSGGGVGFSTYFMPSRLTPGFSFSASYTSSSILRPISDFEGSDGDIKDTEQDHKSPAQR